MSEAKDPESGFVVLREDGWPVLVEDCVDSEAPEQTELRNEHLERLGLEGQSFHVTRYDRHDPELQAHLLKGAELLRYWLARVPRGSGELAWLAADMKLRGAG